MIDCLVLYMIDSSSAMDDVAGLDATSSDATRDSTVRTSLNLFNSFKNADNAYSSWSLTSSNHERIGTAFSGCRQNDIGELSTMIKSESSRPIRVKSLTYDPF